MSFLSRDWTDAEKWGMGIVAALAVAGIIGLWNWNEPISKNDIALLVGYDSAFALALNNQGDDITKIRAEIDARLGLLDLEELSYPTDPADGGPVAEFANQVIGSLSAVSKSQTCAFQLGFAGLVETNTPGTYPTFSIRETGKCAGFSDNTIMSDEQYLESIVTTAREHNS